MSTADDDGPLEHAEPRKVGFDWGWTDGWDGLPPAPGTPPEYREAYDAGYALGAKERNEVPVGTFCPDCDQVHAVGACPLVVVERDPWWLRLYDRIRGPR